MEEVVLEITGDSLYWCLTGSVQNLDALSFLQGMESRIAPYT